MVLTSVKNYNQYIYVKQHVENQQEHVYVRKWHQKTPY